jgi:hypothetical protein
LAKGKSLKKPEKQAVSGASLPLCHGDQAIRFWEDAFPKREPSEAATFF